MENGGSSPLTASFAAISGCNCSQHELVCRYEFFVSNLNPNLDRSFTSALFSRFAKSERQVFRRVSFSMATPKKRLVLHFDVNETIMVGDPVSDVDFEASLNNILAKVAFLNDSKDAWHDGSPLELSKRMDLATAPPLLTTFELEKVQKCYEVNRRDPIWPPWKFTEEGLVGDWWVTGELSPSRFHQLKFRPRIWSQKLPSNGCIYYCNDYQTGKSRCCGS